MDQKPGLYTLEKGLVKIVYHKHSVRRGRTRHIGGRVPQNPDRPAHNPYNGRSAAILPGAQRAQRQNRAYGGRVPQNPDRPAHKPYNGRSAAIIPCCLKKGRWKYLNTYEQSRIFCQFINIHLVLCEEYPAFLVMYYKIRVSILGRSHKNHETMGFINKYCRIMV